MMYAYNTPLYEHTHFCTPTKYLVRMHKLYVHIQHIFNGYTPFVHMQYGCVRVIVQNTFLHVKKGFCTRIIFNTITKYSVREKIV